MKAADSTDKTVLRLKVAHKLKHLRETVRKMSPEDVAQRVNDLGGEVSPSYIRRIENGTNGPTVEMLQSILAAMDSNLGLFFEDFIDEAPQVTVQDRRYQRILQRALDGPARSEVIAVLKLIERSL